MNNITVIEKPENVSYDVIHQILWEANENNRRQGFVLKTSEMEGSELKNKVGDNGRCYIALDGDSIVGTISAKCIKKKTWYSNGKVAVYMLAGVIPQYQHKGISTLLAEKVFCYAKENGCKIVELDTAEGNKNAIAVYLHQGFKLVGFKANTNGDHYSVIMAKWLEGCNHSQYYCYLRYVVRKILVKIWFTHDKKKRVSLLRIKR